MNRRILRILFASNSYSHSVLIMGCIRITHSQSFFYQDLPGYTIGWICIWEFVVLLVAATITRSLIKKWGSAEIQEIKNKRLLTMHHKFADYFGIYFLVAIVVGIWQFWLFSQKL